MSVSSLTARVAVRPLAVGLVVVALSAGQAAWEAAASTVAVTVDGQRQVVKTHGSTVRDALKAAGITVGPHDLLAPAPDVELTESTSVVVRRGRLMELVVDGAPREVWVTAMSVSEALDQVGLRAAGAVLSADRSRAIPLKGFSLEVRTRKQVQILDAGKVRKVATNGLVVSEVLREQRLRVRPADRLAPAATAPLRNGAIIRITRVDGRTLVDNDPIAFSVVRKADSSMYRGETKTVRAGRLGVVKRTYALKYVNGKLAAKRLTSAVRTAEPVSKVVKYGTKTRPYSVAGADHLNWWRLAECESGNRLRATGGGGRYRGLYQFSLSTWRSVGGQGDPIDWGRGEQTYRAKLLYKSRGSSPWPHCGKYLYS